jgi:hypothetical protein
MRLRPSFLPLAVLSAAAVYLALPRPVSPVSFGVAMVVMLVAVLLGSAAAAPFGKGAPVADAIGSGRAPGAAEWRRLALAPLVGAGAGGALLVALVWAAAREPALAARLAPRTGQAAWMPWALAFESAVIEEIVLRLGLMSVVAWLVARLAGAGNDGDRPVVLWTAVAVSTLAFGLVHLPAWLEVAEPTAFLIATVLLFNGGAGVVLCLVYWRWGLLAAILCHTAADLVVQTLGPALLAR